MEESAIKGVGEGEEVGKKGGRERGGELKE